jgi:trk system potassium uptake protein TrkH|tara:strand:+ start:1435 stop:3012 length:1578 start_codon:yes stop_codon:yes gene_type:complete
MSPANRRWTSTTAHVGGNALIFVALAMALSALVEVIDGDEAPAMFVAAAMTGALGVCMRRWTRTGVLDRSMVFTAVGATWVLVSVVGALPYVLAGTFVRDGAGALVVLADAFFESVSGYSCTGSTVFGVHNPIEAQGSGILLYRQLTQWLGGMGIVVLVVAVLPSLRASGLGLIDAEAPGEGADRLAPKVVDTARQFWKVYGVLTVIGAVLLLAAGMNPFDAVAHALSAISTGGFSTRNASIGYWNSVPVELVVMAVMIMGAASFTLHARSYRTRRFAHLGDPEFRWYLGLIGGWTLVVAVLLAADGMAWARALRMSAFNVVTLGTSGGFGNATGAGSDGDFAVWAAGPQVMLLLLLVVGGCTGSTSGGIKVIRLRIGVAHAYRALRAMRRPRAVLHVRYGDRTVPESLVERIAGFMVVFGMFAVIGTMLVAALGTDLVTAFTGVIEALGNMGPAFGEAGPTASFVDGYSTPARLLLATLMLVGRLEIFPMVLMLIVPYRSIRHVAPKGRLRQLRERRDQRPIGA